MRLLQDHLAFKEHIYSKHLEQSMCPSKRMFSENACDLPSGDVGVGLNVRRLRSRFLKTFVTSYSLCPIGDIGSVLRQFPGIWQVFVEDESVPGRYKLIGEREERPSSKLSPDNGTTLLLHMSSGSH